MMFGTSLQRSEPLEGGGRSHWLEAMKGVPYRLHLEAVVAWRARNPLRGFARWFTQIGPGIPFRVEGITELQELRADLSERRASTLFRATAAGLIAFTKVRLAMEVYAVPMRWSDQLMVHHAVFVAGRCAGGAIPTRCRNRRRLHMRGSASPTEANFDATRAWFARATRSEFHVQRLPSLHERRFVLLKSATSTAN